MLVVVHLMATPPGTASSPAQEVEEVDAFELRIGFDATVDRLRERALLRAECWHGGYHVVGQLRRAAERRTRTSSSSRSRWGRRENVEVVLLGNDLGTALDVDGTKKQ